MGGSHLVSAKTAIFLSVRDKATRLPHKISRIIHGKKVIEHLVERIKKSTLADMVVLTTSTHHNDKWLAELARAENIQCYLGSEEDKLQRYLDAAKKFSIDFAVIVDGDDIFCDPECIDKIIEKFHADQNDYILYEGLPLGVTGFGIKISALEKVVSLKTEQETEVWGNYFTDLDIFNVSYLEAPLYLRRPEIRMTLDYEADLKFFEVIFDALYVPGVYMSLREIIDFLDKHPEYIQINQEAQKQYEEKINQSRKNIIEDVQCLQRI